LFDYFQLHLVFCLVFIRKRTCLLSSRSFKTYAVINDIHLFFILLISVRQGKFKENCKSKN